MKHTAPILLFSFISMGLHAAVAILFNSSSVISLPQSEGSVMTLKLENEKAIKKSTYATEKTANLLPSKELTKISPAMNDVSVINKKIQTTKIEHTSLSKARIVSILHKELRQQFKYPKLAQRRNWQGKVILSLHITSNGVIENIEINNSSGYNVLDQAAINSLTKLGALPTTSTWLALDVDLLIPVIYQLTEG